MSVRDPLMTIRFKCPHCQKPLSVKDHLAGKKAACPACKKAITIPAAPPPASEPIDAEAFAAEAFADQPPEKPPEPVSCKTIDFTCPFCDEELKLSADLGGKKTPCPKCTNIIKVPLPQDDKPKDWRTTQTGGPSLAKTNAPEQLSDAWGTEQKGRVSREAMEEAAALPEVAAQPLGVGGWIKRGFWVVVVGGGALLLISQGIKSRATKQEQDHLKKAFEYLPQLEALQKAELFRAAGEIDVRNFRVEDAQRNFTLALSAVPSAQDDTALNYERDLLLIKLVLGQAQMGGSGDETLHRGKVNLRFDWSDGKVQKNISQTLQAIHTPEATASALRDLASKLIDKDKIAFEIVSPFANTGERSPFRAQLVGLLMAFDKDVSEFFPGYDPKFIIDTTARVGHTEGHARKGDYAEALKIASAKGTAGRVEACVAGAAIALADTKNKDAAGQAAQFIREGLQAHAELVKERKDKAASWSILELIRLGSRTEAAEEVKGLVDKLPASLRPRAQLDILQAKLDKSNVPEATSLDDELGDDKNPTRAFAWEALARHNARLGGSGDLRTAAEEVNASLRPFLHLGIALGQQDAKLNK